MTSLLFVIMSQEQELALDDERRGYDEARQAVTVLERKRVALVTELDDVRALLEAVSIYLLQVAMVTAVENQQTSVNFGVMRCV